MAMIRKRFFLVLFIVIIMWLVYQLNHFDSQYFNNLKVRGGSSLFKDFNNNDMLAAARSPSKQLIKSLQPVDIFVPGIHSNSFEFCEERNCITLYITADEYGMIKTQEDQQRREIGYKKHAFNVLVSSNIGLIRDLPDTRHKICTQQAYLIPSLPTASIIMCFFNEHLDTLLRSIFTVLRRTPMPLLKEIILVDDFSDNVDLKIDLVRRLSEIDSDGRIHLIRNTMREGLIRARVIGARHATGDALVFLDSHIEVNQEWLEPLLEIISKENSTLAVPVIDIINSDTFVYSPSPLVRGGFNWGLHFKWEDLPQGTIFDEKSFLGPFKSPTMAGGLFAVNRKYFKAIGEYDMGMDIWGGENLEISFRVWQCGGSIKILPCSRVGHVFRKRRPYGSPDGSNTVLRNSLRLAHVWMDSYKNYFLENQKTALKFDFGNIQDRLDLRKEMHCKSFQWYVDNVYPELEIPGMPKNPKLPKANFQPWNKRKRKYVNNFLIRLANTTLCVSIDGKQQTAGKWKRGANLLLRPCMRVENQLWYETDKAEFVLGKLYCLEAANSEGHAFPVLGKCHEMFGDQEWKHNKDKNTPLYNVATGLCLRTSKSAIGSTIHLDLCSKESLNIWDLM